MVANHESGRHQGGVSRSVVTMALAILPFRNSRFGSKRATDSVTSGGGTCSDSGHTRLAESITRTLEFR
jgi:hypothetical protein